MATEDESAAEAESQTQPQVPAEAEAARKPEISYPAEWGYRIVCTSAEEVRAHLAGILDEVEHELVQGNESASGKYVTLQLTLVVDDEDHRLRIYEHLGGHAAVRFVL